VRLGTCLALEIAVACGAIGGVWFGVGRASELAGDYFTTREAAASTVTPLGPQRPLLALPRAQLASADARHEDTSVFGAPDAELLAPINAAKVTRVKLNHGGISLSLRVDFANGARASFKPEQTWPQSDPRREIAAYRIDRLLGIGHVSPAKPIAVPLEDVLAAADPGMRGLVIKRVTEEGIAHKGVLSGEAQWWIPEITLARLGAARIDEPDGRALWTQYLQADAAMPAPWRSMLAQISTLLVFDQLIDNADRWSGSNTEMSPDGTTLYFMDNTMAFSNHDHVITAGALHRIQRFSRALIGRLRGLTREAVVAALGDGEVLGPLLQDAEIDAILVRRDGILEYVDHLIAKYGEDEVLAFP
jgi:hypothetical protein